jgi:histidine decarboxylase
MFFNTLKFNRVENGFFDYLEKIGVVVNKATISACERELTLCNHTFEEKNENMLGYPIGMLSSFLPEPILEKLLVNVGDWRGNKYPGPNTNKYEFEANKYMKEIFDFPVGQKDFGSSYTGSSEAVLSGIIYARSVLQLKTGLKPVVFASVEAHYCVRKSAFITGLDFITIKTDENSGMDMADFRFMLTAYSHVPVIVVATCGTTVREGYDPIRDICETLDIHHQAGSYVHIDAALSGFTAPFLKEVSDDVKPRFRKNVGSISVSLHKFAACNRPGALLLGIDQGVNEAPMMGRVDYIDATDGTPSGCRSGQPVLAFAMLYRMIGRNGFQAMAQDCLAKAEYLSSKLRSENIEVFHNPGALTVYMPCPSDQIVSKYSLACSGGGAHVITMQHVSMELIDHFVADYVSWYNSTFCK